MLPTIWNPFETLSAVENRIDDLFGSFTRFHPVVMRSPSVDISEDDKKITVQAEVPGMGRKDIQITVEDHHMTLRGEKRSEKKEKRENGHSNESFYGSFSRTFHLPETVERKKIKAKLKNGVLEITLPKRSEAKPKKIAVEVN